LTIESEMDKSDVGNRSESSGSEGTSYFDVRVKLQARKDIGVSGVGAAKGVMYGYGSLASGKGKDPI
jgi:hypothetical protein